MKTSWFTSGQQHSHRLDSVTLDRDTIVRITDEDPRAKMFELFGDKWSMEYSYCPTMEFFPGGCYDINQRKFVDPRSAVEA
jgi:hypothetical protein